jgi:CubicO group peptidase (beta-lactamase class C family)
MNIRNIFRLVCFAPILLSVPVPAAAQSDFTADEVDGIKAFLRDNFTQTNAALVIGLVDGHGRQVFSAGTLDNGTQREPDRDTVFFIGSVSKTFTTLLLEDMVERRQMKLDDPVAGYLPASVRMSARNGKEVTLLHLASASAGFPINPDNMTGVDVKEQYETYTVEKMYAYLSGYTLRRDPGAEFEYSNLGMALLGHVIALKAGTNFESLVVSRICQPLGMDSTCINLTAGLKARLAMGHDASGKPSPPWRFQAYSPAGDIHSTANDLLKFVSAYAGLTTSILTTLMAKTHVFRFTDSLGLADLPGSGLFGQTAMDWVDRGVQPPGMELLGHAGGAGSYHAWIGFDKKQRRGVVVLSTANDNLSVEAIGWTLLRRLPLTRESALRFEHEIIGIGAALAADDSTGMVRITKIYSKSPADLAGLSAGLLIQKINGVSVAGKSVAECLRLMAGRSGTTERLEVINPERKETNAVQLTRGKFLISG